MVSTCLTRRERRSNRKAPPFLTAQTPICRELSVHYKWIVLGLIIWIYVIDMKALDFFCSIRSGIFNARQCLSEGIKVGLGTGASYCDKRNMYRYWSLGSPCVQSDYKKLVTQTTVYFLMISENKRKLYTQDHQPVHMCRKTWSVPYFDDVSRTSPYVHVYTCN